MTNKAKSKIRCKIKWAVFTINRCSQEFIHFADSVRETNLHCHELATSLNKLDLKALMEGE